ncbi:MAG TPA: histidine--tRNA ligase [Candidatus Atribacteria bacterium]|nr:histidine--tRNA ligase [Candidatus Atribacteria bacterium]
MEKITLPKGTKDIGDPEIFIWYHIENIVRQEAAHYHYIELRTPLFEHTELFARGVGEETDIVQKEMYTFLDKGGRSVTLRPEGTAPVMRSYLEQGFHIHNPRMKYFYMGPMFRYERPQAGRMRQFHQFGFEAIGFQSPAADAEIILLADRIYKKIGLKNIRLEINSLGCKKCKPQYLEALKNFLRNQAAQFCKNCTNRIETNPLRVLDCKNESCQNILHSESFPIIQIFLCDECLTHQNHLIGILESAQIHPVVNPYLVRGLDYYIKTTFEMKTEELGAQNAIGGGGRYDNLSDALGVKSIPGVGFAAGMERIILLLQKQSESKAFFQKPFIYLSPLDQQGEDVLLQLSIVLDENSIPFHLDFSDKSLKYHFKNAQRMGASFIIIAGENEYHTKTYTLKNMLSGEQKVVSQKTLIGDLLEAYQNVKNT